MYLCFIHTQAEAKVGLQWSVCKTQFISFFYFILITDSLFLVFASCIIFHRNCKPTFAPLCTCAVYVCMSIRTCPCIFIVYDQPHSLVSCSQNGPEMHLHVHVLEGGEEQLPGLGSRAFNDSTAGSFPGSQVAGRPAPLTSDPLGEGALSPMTGQLRRAGRVGRGTRAPRPNSYQFSATVQTVAKCVTG